MSMKQTLTSAGGGHHLGFGAQAQCLSDGDVGVMASHYAQIQDTGAQLSRLVGCRRRLHARQVQCAAGVQFGKVVGYKAGLTNPAVQKRFNTDKPVGRLYEGTIEQSGASVPAALARALCSRPTCWCA